MKYLMFDLIGEAAYILDRTRLDEVFALILWPLALSALWLYCRPAPQTPAAPQPTTIAAPDRELTTIADTSGHMERVWIIRPIRHCGPTH